MILFGFVFLVIGVLLAGALYLHFVVGPMRGWRRADGTRDSYHYKTHTYPPYIWANWALALFVVWLIPSVIATGAMQYKVSNVENSAYVLNGQIAARDQYLQIFEEKLSTDEFLQLSQAVTPDDIKFLGKLPDVTAFMLGKADRIVAANQAINGAYYKLLDQSRAVCNMRANGFIPQVPVLRPDCNLASVQDLVYNGSVPGDEKES